jgi:Fe-S oxidoreductase
MEGIEVVHTTDYLSRLHKEGKLKFKEGLQWKVTYHDPCHTGRHLNKFLIDDEGTRLWKGAYLEEDNGECLYEQPRDLLKAIPGVEFVEMKRNRANSYCCGGGGGVMTGFGEWARKNAGLRVQEAMETGAEKIISICPFCHFNLNEGAKRIGSQVKVHDLTELMDQVIVGGAGD